MKLDRLISTPHNFVFTYFRSWVFLTESYQMQMTLRTSENLQVSNCSKLLKGCFEEKKKKKGEILQA